MMISKPISLGNICLDILKDKWSALYDVTTILISLQSLLGGYLFNSISNNILSIYISYLLSVTD